MNIYVNNVTDTRKPVRRASQYCVRIASWQTKGLYTVIHVLRKRMIKYYLPYNK
jgi:hypothetical protein